MPFINLTILFLAIGLFENSSGAANETCYFGPHCLMPCHCERKSDECDERTGKCSNNQCGYTEMLHENYRFVERIFWSGPNCQIGNVALNKPTKQIGTYGVLTAQKAVDGRIGTRMQAAHALSDNYQPAWWMVDLLQKHRIYNVTVYNNEDWGDQDLMSSFTISVGDSSDPTTHTPCAFYEGPVDLDDSAALDCNAIGRYVSYHRNPDSYRATHALLAEVVVIGERFVKYDTDCSKCEDRCVSPDDYCARCKPPYLPPTCREPCPMKMFANGSQCLPCGHCAGGEACNLITGTCPKGCERWFVPEETCNTKLATFKMSGSLYVTSVSAVSVTLVFSRASIPQYIHDYYYYQISYRLRDSSETIADSIRHSKGEREVTIRDLQPQTRYQFTVSLVRRNKDNSEVLDSASVNLTTECSRPDVPELTVKQDVFDVRVSYTLQQGSSGCNNYVGVFLYYKQLERETWSKLREFDSTSPRGEMAMTIKPGQQFEFKLRVFNDGEKEAESLVTRAETPAKASALKKRGYREPPMSIGVMTVIAVAVVGVVVAVAILIFRGCKRNDNVAAVNENLEMQVRNVESSQRGMMLR